VQRVNAIVSKVVNVPAAAAFHQRSFNNKLSASLPDPAHDSFAQRGATPDLRQNFRHHAAHHGAG
jgi:hypothetical protein